MPYFIICAVGALLYGAIYLLSVVVAGIWLGHPHATLLAIVTMGVTYLSFSFNLYDLNREAEHQGLRVIANGLTVLTILLGASAGILLLS